MTEIKQLSACSICDALVTAGATGWIDSEGFEDASHPYPHDHDGEGS